MSVAKVIEISSEGDSLDEAIRKGIKRASKTVQKIKAAYINETQVLVDDGEVVGYRVNMKVTFVLD